MSSNQQSRTVYNSSAVLIYDSTYIKFDGGESIYDCILLESQR